MVRARFSGNADFINRSDHRLFGLSPTQRAIGLAGRITVQLARATDCLEENKIEEPKVDRERNGWRGRFRMIAGLTLRMVARKNGFVVIDGKKIQAPGAKAKRGRRPNAKTEMASA